LLDRSVLDVSGALAFDLQDGNLHIKAARSVARLWVGPRPVWSEMLLPPPLVRTALQ
jgi:hypothetical protein